MAVIIDCEQHKCDYFVFRPFSFFESTIILFYFFCGHIATAIKVTKSS